MDKNATHVFIVRSFSWSFCNYFEIVFMTLSGIIENVLLENVKTNLHILIENTQAS